MQNAKFFDGSTKCFSNEKNEQNILSTKDGLFQNSTISGGNHSEASKNENLPENNSFHGILNGFSEQTKEMILEFNTDLSACTEFEQFCLDRLDRLIKDANTLEGHLKQQKIALSARVQQLAQTLQLKNGNSQ